jgi:hypothetical protein
MPLRASSSRTPEASAPRRVAWLWNMMNVPLRWPRITTRRLMALVALVALAFGAEMARRRGEAYAEKAALHAKQERQCRDLADFQDDYVARLKRLADWEEAECAKADYQQNPEWSPGSLRKTATMYVEEAKYTREHVDWYVQADYAARLKRLADWEEAERAKADYQRNLKWTPESLRKTATMYVEEAKYTREHVDFYEKLKAKYQHAARYPWLPVQPDPPMPSRNP